MPAGNQDEAAQVAAAAAAASANGEDTSLLASDNTFTNSSVSYYQCKGYITVVL
jgi:hypothetical protein